MRLGVPKEIQNDEARVAVTPQSVAKLIELGFSVSVERGAGIGAAIPDQHFIDAGAALVDDAWLNVDVVLKVNPPQATSDGAHEADRLTPEMTLVSLIDPARNSELVERLRVTGATVFALDQVPRITRAQKMDVLSSMANIAGYRAVVEAAQAYGGFFSGQITAAGKAAPARVLVIGAGVAGLAAIGAAKSLGAIVRAFDVRPAVREQVESMGAEFLEVTIEESGDGGGGYAKTMSKEFIEAEMALFMEQAKEVDVVITTALIPGRPAPLLFPEEHVKALKPGSVVVDLAASIGGNCECTERGKVVQRHGVTIIGYTDLTSRQPGVASRFFGTNLAHFMSELGGAHAWSVDHDNEVLRGALVTQGAQVFWPAPRKAPAAKPKPAPEPVVEEPEPEPKAKARKPSGAGTWIALIVFSALLMVVGQFAPTAFLQHLTVFILAVFVGWQLIWNVSASLHTPLMSVTNAISGIILVGGAIQAGSGRVDAASILGAIAILVASINVVGGFLVTQRMLAMFRRD